MPHSGAERRRGRRANVQAPMMIRHAGKERNEPGKEEITQNVSLAGVYFETEDFGSYAVNDSVMSSVSVPESQRREFPFTRLAGRSRVVRVNELPHLEATGRKRIGVALEFGDDVTALTAIPPR